jgi:hypothetical protein
MPTSDGERVAFAMQVNASSAADGAGELSAWSRDSSDASCRISVHFRGCRSLIVKLVMGDGSWGVEARTSVRIGRRRGIRGWILTASAI